jgi:hypothetical protein
MQRSEIIDKKNRLLKEYEENNPRPVLCDGCHKITEEAVENLLKQRTNLANVYCEKDLQALKRHCSSKFDWVIKELSVWEKEVSNEDTHRSSNQTQ